MVTGRAWTNRIQPLAARSLFGYDHTDFESHPIIWTENSIIYHDWNRYYADSVVRGRGSLPSFQVVAE